MRLRDGLLGIVAGASLLCSTGCVQYAAYTRHTGKKVPAEIQEYYSYPKIDSRNDHVRIIAHKDRKNYCLKTLEVKVDEQKRIRFDYFDVKGEQKDPLALVIPILGGETYLAEHYFARRLAGEYGISSIVMHRPEIGAEVEDPEVLERMLKESVVDARTLLDWARQQKDIDAQKMALIGISVGSMRGVVLYALESEDLKGAVLGLGGRSLSHIITYSAEGAMRGKGLSERRKSFLEKNSMSLRDMEIILKDKIKTSPEYFAEYLDPDNLMMVVAMCDQVVPSKEQLELRKDLGKPPTIFLPTGHYTSAFYLPYIVEQTAIFLQDLFKEDR